MKKSETLVIRKGKVVKIVLYAIITAFFLGLYLFIKHERPDGAFMHYILLFAFSISAIFLSGQVFSRVKLIKREQKFIVLDGIAFFRSKYTFLEEEVVEVRFKRYSSGRSVGAGKGGYPNLPMNGYDGQTNLGSTYSVLIKLNKKRPIEFGKYINRRKIGRIVEFVSSKEG